MTHRAALPALLLALAAPACVDGMQTGSSDSDVSGATTYIDLFDFSKIDQGGWYDAISKLNGEFVAADQASFVPLTFACSVSSKEGVVHDCAWTFASAQIEVDATSAKLQTDAPTYVCHVSEKTTAVKLAQFLASSADSFHDAPPWGSAPIASQISSCFDSPIGATPIVSGPTSPLTYVAASDYYTSVTSQKKWTAARAALKLGFDNICGDTFCGGDFGNLQAMEFECAVTKSSGNIKSCEWVFAGSYNQVDAAHGTDLPASQSWTCPVAVKGTLPQLIATLTNTTDPEDAIHRTLPGETYSAYDAIGNNCLP